MLLRRSVALARHRRAASTIAVGVSGGVDSALAALLLRAQGHDVIGVHMTNWDAAEEAPEAASCIEQEARDARRVCDHVGIGFHEVNFVREYWHNIFEPLLEGYSDGGTPNPDVACNRHIKFDRFVSHALALGADCVATGHYARLDHACETTRLLTAMDAGKDQTYFLAAVRQQGLQKALFPIGHLHKADVRALAACAGLHTAAKRDSTGICFIGKRRFGDFLGGYLPQMPGEFRCVESGRAVGRHKGYALYTPGQRARVSGARARWYCVDKDVASNVVWVCEGHGHSSLYTRSLVTHPTHWVSGAPPAALRTAGGTMRCEVRIRHPGELHACTVEVHSPEGHTTTCNDDPEAGSALLVRFDEPVRSVAPLQALAMYDGHVCLGGANIARRGRSLWEEMKGVDATAALGGGAAPLVAASRGDVSMGHGSHQSSLKSIG